MPTYQYVCTSCQERLEVVQRFTDDPLTLCPVCGGQLRKVFTPVGVLFKGSGFYRTDSRPNGTKEKAGEPGRTKDTSDSPDTPAAQPTKPAAKSGSAA